MDYSGSVRCSQARGHLFDDVHYLARCESLSAGNLADGLTVNELSRDEVGAITLANFVDRKDVRMIQRGCGPRLSLKTAQPLIVRGKVRRQNFQRDQPIEATVLGQVNFTHSSRTQGPDDRVLAHLANGSITKQDVRVLGQRWSFNKISRVLVSVEQRRGFVFQFMVVPATLNDKIRALGPWQIQGVLQYFFDLLPTFRG